MIDKIERLLADKFQHETDFQDCFLIESKLLPTNKLELLLKNVEKSVATWKNILTLKDG